MKAPMLTIAQAAERLNCHHGLVRRLVATGKLTASKIGKEWRIEPENLEAFIVATRQVPPSPAVQDGEQLPAIEHRRFT